MNKFLLFILLCLLYFPAMAADNAPLEISADKALEWNQTAKTYTARGNAVAKQGDVSIRAETLTALYTKNSSDITSLSATGGVTLSTATDTATSEDASYDLTSGKAILSGGRPKIVQNGKNTLEAEQITVWTVGNILDRAEAVGHVVITAGEQVATGDKATYHAKTSIASLIGNVKVKQGENWLQGDRADMNMITRVSTLSNQHSAGRVKGIFYSRNTGKKDE